MTYDEFFVKFVVEDLPGLDDAVAQRCAWNDRVDALVKAGTITRVQAETWANPFRVEGHNARLARAIAVRIREVYDGPK